MSPALLRGALGSCLAVGAADLAWLDVNAERMTSSASASMVQAESVAPASRIERLPRLPPPLPILDETTPSVMKPDPLPPPPERCVVYFDNGVAVLTDDQVKTLTPIAEAVKKEPRAIVRVDGHADRTGWKDNKGSNYALSNERAVAIVRALSQLGVPRERIWPAAFGDRMPVDDRPTEEALRRNRRVEVRIELPGER
jgi:outer membrane protein OmpA-like peptidoglycan-associated protein